MMHEHRNIFPPYDKGKAKMSGEMKVRVYPSGMLEVLGGNPDEVALVAAAVVSKGFFKGEPQDNHPELPLSNGTNNQSRPVNLHRASDRAAFLKQTAPKVPYDAPFYDESVCMSHPAIMKLEKSISLAPVGEVFELKKLRYMVGESITGVWRECLTRSVGTLMGRLTRSGMVGKISGHEWKKLPKLEKK